MMLFYANLKLKRMQSEFDMIWKRINDHNVFPFIPVSPVGSPVINRPYDIIELLILQDKLHVDIRALKVSIEKTYDDARHLLFEKDFLHKHIDRLNTMNMKRHPVNETLAIDELRRDDLIISAMDRIVEVEQQIKLYELKTKLCSQN